jgi:hypothetical protein
MFSVVFLLHSSYNHLPSFELVSLFSEITTTEKQRVEWVFKVRISLLHVLFVWSAYGSCLCMNRTVRPHIISAKFVAFINHVYIK